MEVGVLGKVGGGGAGQGVGGGRAFQTGGGLRNNELSKQEKKRRERTFLFTSPFLPYRLFKMGFSRFTGLSMMTVSRSSVMQRNGIDFNPSITISGVDYLSKSV